ncbi:MAG: ABC transporter substrate-binding protein, partial [Candidatus Bathyarchaeota archaeon]|nr:ABC transporter substrate-binding protein [Candidatus Bathyarchaeota archaeon]
MAETKKPVNRRNFLKYAGAGIVAAAAVGGGYYYSTQKPPTQTQPPTTILGEPVKIAVPAPLSGPYAYYGNELMEGIREGVLDVNAAGGVLGRPVEYLVRDTEL